MERIICHWSEGNYRANDVDLKAYHILIEGDGRVRFGHFSIADNINTSDGRYAAHTLHCNTRSIGVACCCMTLCCESPFHGGAQPLKEVQWQTMIKVVADLCEFYGIPVTSTTVLGHGEVQDNLGITQRGKWDPLVLPWDNSTFDVSTTRHVVGDLLRAEVRAQLAACGDAVVESVARSRRPSALVIPPTAAPVLRSKLFAGNNEIESIAAGHRVLRTSAQPAPGIGTVQDALNRLAEAGLGDYQIDLGEGARFRGYFGQRTERAVIAFQRDQRQSEDGVVGEDTIRALDAELLRLEQAPPPAVQIETLAKVAVPSSADVPVAGTVTLSGYAPPARSARLFHGVDFSNADESRGQPYVDAFAAADRSRACGDPSNCKTILQFNDGTVYYDAKMAICADGSPRAKQIDYPYGQTQTAFTFPPNGSGSFFNAEDVPYIVLPGRSKDGVHDLAASFGIRMYDLAVVVYRDKFTPAFFGEIGPTFRIGEASIKVHEGLPVPFPWTSQRRERILNASVERDVVYCVFPGSAVFRTGAMSEADWLDETLQAAVVRFEHFIANGGQAPHLGTLG
ncbi:MAG: N-acetylmuramoyl-L-alanine amidase [Verrucomicrobiota bacterium]|nr:N-acetylmuramoyl-L-alanine amidase [Verrucomicrobiota bacterium]